MGAQIKAMDFPMRLNKFLAQKGFTTRRGADALIAEKRVFVNGKPATLGQKVSETDRVEIDNFSTKHYTYVIFYKPRGVITHSPSEGEVDIAAYIKKEHQLVGLFPVGRLDKASEGLVLLTNDGRVTERLLNPEQGHVRTYEVVVDKPVTEHLLRHLSRGVQIEGYMTKPAVAKVGAHKNQLLIELTEGKKHQVRRMCAALGYQVQSLKRTKMLNLELKRLKPGQVYKLKPKEVKEFTQLLGIQ